MSCFNPTRRVALAGLAATLAGCGFQPLHGTGGAAHRLRGKVSVTVPQSVGGYRMGDQLDFRFGPTQEPLYALTATLETEEETSIITNDQETRRFSLVGTSGWQLQSLSDGKQLVSGRARAVASYSASGTTVATETARRDALDRLAVMLADRIADQIALSDL